MADTLRAGVMKRGDTWQEVCGTPDLEELPPDDAPEPDPEPKRETK